LWVWLWGGWVLGGIGSEEVEVVVVVGCLRSGFEGSGSGLPLRRWRRKGGSDVVSFLLEAGKRVGGIECFIEKEEEDVWFSFVFFWFN
jgi:hypothetical protein